MININAKPFARDEFYNGEYQRNSVSYPFTITRLVDFDSDSNGIVITWGIDLPYQHEDVEDNIIETFTKLMKIDDDK